MAVGGGTTVAARSSDPVLAHAAAGAGVQWHRRFSRHCYVDRIVECVEPLCASGRHDLPGFRRATRTAILPARHHFDDEYDEHEQ